MNKTIIKIQLIEGVTIRILFIESDDRFIFGLPLGFRDAGHTILVSGALEQCNLDQLTDNFKPHLAILMGWSSIHTEQNIDLIKETLQSRSIPYIYWATEDPTFTEYFSVPLVKRLSPYCIFTVSSQTVMRYKDLGYTAFYLPFGYQPSIFRQAPVVATQNIQISLVANAYPNVFQYEPTHYRQKSLSLLLNPLLEQHIRVDLWGKYWNKMQPYLTYSIPTIWQHGEVHYLNTNKIYNSSKIILGLQNYAEDVVAMRTYEILGSGGFLMTSYHTNLQEFFTPGKDFIMVESEEAMLSYAQFFLNHPIERSKIQMCGQQSVAKHSYRVRALEIEKRLKEECIIN